jgi:Tol biopolymer transport system component
MDKNRGNISEQGTWTKDGRQIYYRTNENGTFDVGRYDMKTGKKEIVVADENLNMKHPVELEDGRVAGYGGPPGEKYKTVDKYSDIWIADPSKGTYTLITHTDGSFAYKHPAPFGEMILAHKEPKNSDTEAADLIVLNPKTGEETNITNTPQADERHVFFNEKAGLLTYHSDGSGDKNLWLSTPDGGKKCQLTHYGKPAQSPCWSPDGKKIYFVRKNEKQAEGENFYVRQADIRVIDVRTALKDLVSQAKDRMKTLKSMDADTELIKEARMEYENYQFFLEKFGK